MKPSQAEFKLFDILTSSSSNIVFKFVLSSSQTWLIDFYWRAKPKHALLDKENKRKKVRRYYMWQPISGIGLLSCTCTIPLCPNRPTHLKSQAVSSQCCKLAHIGVRFLTLLWWTQFCFIKISSLYFYVHIFHHNSFGLPILCLS